MTKAQREAKTGKGSDSVETTGIEGLTAVRSERH